MAMLNNQRVYIIYTHKNKPSKSDGKIEPGYNNEKTPH